MLYLFEEYKFKPEIFISTQFYFAFWLFNMKEKIFINAEKILSIVINLKISLICLS